MWRLSSTLKYLMTHKQWIMTFHNDNMSSRKTSRKCREEGLLRELEMPLVWKKFRNNLTMPLVGPCTSLYQVFGEQPDVHIRRESEFSTLQTFAIKIEYIRTQHTHNRTRRFFYQIYIYTCSQQVNICTSIHFIVSLRCAYSWRFYFFFNSSLLFRILSWTIKRAYLITLIPLP